MGYYSHFSIEVEDRRPDPEDLLLELIEGNENALRAVAQDGTANESAKWYEWAEDMRKFSEKHRDFLFTVHREGEEPGDIEVGYFINGTHQGGKAEVRLPEFKP